MATQLKMHNKGEEDDDDDLEALRLAALKTLRPKPAPFCPPPVSTVVYHTQRNRVPQGYQNPNLITIVPMGADPDPVFKPPPRVVTNPMVRFNSNVKVLNRVNSSQNNTYLKSNVPTVVDAKAKKQDEEEVSTKFSRFEDTESESEDESVTDDKGSDSSEESDADCIALQDDDSLEALMAQMEQEFGEESETKTEKKKNKSSSKTKSKSNTKGEEKKNEKVEQKIVTEKTAQEVKPNRETRKPRSQTKSVPPVKIEVKPMTRSPVKCQSPEYRPSSPKYRPVSPSYKVFPLRQRSPVKITSKTHSPVRPKSPVRQRSPIRLKSPVKSPKHSPLRSKSPHSRSKSPIHSSRLKSPVRQKPLRSPLRQNSPLRSPVKQKSPLKLSPVRRSRSPLRPYSPVGKYSIHRKSPIRRSPSPYGRVRRSRSPLRKRSPSPFLRKDRGFLPRSKDRSPKYSPNYYNKTPSPGRDRRSRTPPKKWCPLSPRRRSPLSPNNRYRSPNQIRRSISPRRVYSRSPTPPYYSPRRRSPSPFKKKIAPRRRSVSPSPTPRRSISPRRRSVSPKRREFSPLRRPLSPKVDITSKRITVSPRRKPSSPKFKKYSPVRSPVRRQRSVSPQRRISPLRKKMNSPPRQKRDRGWNKNERPKSDTDTKANDWSRSSSVSLSPSPQPRDRDIAQAEELPRRHKSPLRVQKASGDNLYYNKSEKRPISPDNRNGDGDVVDRRRGGRNWDRSGKSWDGRRSDRDRRRDRTIGSRSRKEASKNEKTNSTNKNDDVPTFPQKTNDPVLEARRKKFESNDLVEPASKKIRLRNSPVKEKMIENVEVQTEPEEIVSKPEPEDDFNLDLDIEDDILDLGGEMWSSDEGEPIVKHNGNPLRKVVRAPSPKKKKSVKERITLEEKVDKPKRKSSTTTSTEVRPVNTKDTASSPLAVAQKEEDIDKVEEKSDKDESPVDRGMKEEMDSDLRAELSRRRAERLTKAGSVHKNLPARIVQSAFEGVMGKKKVKKEKKEKESKSKEKVKKSPPPVQDVPKEKSDGRRVLVLKRTAPVRLPSQAAINVTFPEDNEESSGSESDEKYVSPLKRKLPIHYRLGLPEEKKRTHKVRKVKLKHRHQV